MGSNIQIVGNRRDLNNKKKNQKKFLNELSGMTTGREICGRILKLLDEGKTVPFEVDLREAMHVSPTDGLDKGSSLDHFNMGMLEFVRTREAIDKRTMLS